MPALNTYERADGTTETLHLHEVNAMHSQLRTPDAVHAELATRLGFTTVEEFLTVNGGNLKAAATPATETEAAA
jgi:hypothetical protein